MCEDQDGNLSNCIKPNSVVKHVRRPISRNDCCVYEVNTDLAHVKCQFCDMEVDTVPGGNLCERDKCWYITLGCFGCCAWSDVVHTCPNCQQEIRRYNGSQQCCQTGPCAIRRIRRLQQIVPKCQMQLFAKGNQILSTNVEKPRPMAERDHVTRYVNEVLDTCNMVKPKLQIAKRSIVDTTEEKHTLNCKKLLFLLGNSNAGMAVAVGNWVTAVFKGVNDTSEKVLIVYELQSNAEEMDEFKLTKHPSLRTITVKTLKDVFQWWPKTIDFIYKKKPVGVLVHLTTDIEIKRSDEESESVNLEQSHLKDNISELLQFNRAELVDDDGTSKPCKIVIVVFGRDISVSSTMYSSLRRAKINGVKIFFFFPHDVQAFDRKIKQISSYRYTVSQHMEGILFLMGEIALKKLRLPLLRKPLIPTGPLIIYCEYDENVDTAALNAVWVPYPYGLGETISVQTRASMLSKWQEIAADIPATKNVITLQIKGRPSSSMFNYRIMCEDQDGNLSNCIKPNSVTLISGNWLSESTRNDCCIYELDTDPAHVKCQFCNMEVDTVPDGNLCKRDKCWCIILGCFGCCACCDVVHTCPNCHQEIRRYNGSQ